MHSIPQSPVLLCRALPYNKVEETNPAPDAAVWVIFLEKIDAMQNLGMFFNKFRLGY